jgi:hypothetical protein
MRPEFKLKYCKKKKEKEKNKPENTSHVTNSFLFQISHFIITTHPESCHTLFSFLQTKDMRIRKFG